MTGLFRSLSGLFSSAFESTPPIIVAASRSLSLSSTDDTPPPTATGKTSSASASSKQPEAKLSSASSSSGGGGGCDAIPEVDLSHLSVEEREKIAAVLARASSADATRTDSDIDRQVNSLAPPPTGQIPLGQNTPLATTWGTDTFWDRTSLQATAFV